MHFKLFIFLILTNFFVTSANPLREGELYANFENNSVQQEKSTSNNTDRIKKTKDYILFGQEDKSEAEKIKWSPIFLNQVNIEQVYQEYLSTGATAQDIQSFAQYLTLNAPIADNWQELVATDLLNAYGEKISRIEPLQDTLYQIYINIEGLDVPYVVVNARTGYFHG
jgi:hypothetical protein